MNDYLGNLVARQLDQAESVQPRLALRFEPPALRLPGAQTSMGGIEWLERDATSNELELESEASVEPTLDGQPRPAAPQRSTTMLELTERDSPTLSSRATRESAAPLRPTTASEHSSAQVTSSVDSTRAQAPNQSASEQDSSSSSSSSSEIHASAKASSVQPSTAPLTSRRSLTEVHVSTNQERGEAEAQQESRLTPTQAVTRKLVQSGKPEKPDSAQLIQPLHQSARDDDRARGERMTGQQNDMPQSAQNHLVPIIVREIAQPAPSSNNSLPVARLRDTDESPRGSRLPAPLEHASETPARSSRPQPNVLVQPRITPLTESRVLAYDESNSAREAEPVINVTIGRIEVRATHAPAANRRQNASAPLMSLNDYLRQRAGGGGR